MAESTDEDAARFMRSPENGVLESEFESRENEEVNTGSDLPPGEEQLTGADESSAEGCLEIAEESGDGGCEAIVPSAVVSASADRPKAGFGQIDESESDEEALVESGDCDKSDHSTESDNRHSLDYLCDRQGKSLSYLLVAS